MSGRRYIPSSEADFTVWCDHFTQTVTTKSEVYQLTDQQIAQLKQAADDWNTTYQSAVAKRDEAKAAIKAKDECKARVGKIVRSAAQSIQANLNVTDAARVDAGLPVHKSSRQPVPVPHTAPVLTVMISARLEHALDFGTGDRQRRRPAGVMGVEIWMVIGNEMTPVNPDVYSFLGTCSRGPKTITFNADDAGRVAHYLTRWVNHKGETGPWSSPVSATIPVV